MRSEKRVRKTPLRTAVFDILPFGKHSDSRMAVPERSEAQAVLRFSSGRLGVRLVFFWEIAQELGAYGTL